MHTLVCVSVKHLHRIVLVCWYEILAQAHVDMKYSMCWRACDCPHRILLLSIVNINLKSLSVPEAIVARWISQCFCLEAVISGSEQN